MPEDDLSTKTVYFKVLSLRESDVVQDQLDVFNLLQEVPGSLQQHFQNTWASTYYFRNIEAGKNSFWKVAASDMPGPLAQTSMLDPDRLQRGQTSKDFLSTKQYLSRHADFKNLMLTTDNMTCVSRNDGGFVNFPWAARLTQIGVLLTMLSSKGMNYLLNSRTSIPWPNVMLSSEEYCLSRRARFKWAYRYEEGRMKLIENLSSNEHIETLLFDIILDFHHTPTVDGVDMSGPEDAYEQIVQELVSPSLWAGKTRRTKAQMDMNIATYHSAFLPFIIQYRFTLADAGTEEKPGVQPPPQTGIARPRARFHRLHERNFAATKSHREQESISPKPTAQVSVI